ncbi:hypothetical protein D3C87_1357780 [compost metagenome]
MLFGKLTNKLKAIKKHKLPTMAIHKLAFSAVCLAISLFCFMASRLSFIIAKISCLICAFMVSSVLFFSKSEKSFSSLAVASFSPGSVTFCVCFSRYSLKTRILLSGLSLISSKDKIIFREYSSVL